MPYSSRRWVSPYSPPILPPPLQMDASSVKRLRAGESDKRSVLSISQTTTQSMSPPELDKVFESVTSAGYAFLMSNGVAVGTEPLGDTKQRLCLTAATSAGVPQPGRASSVDSNAEDHTIHTEDEPPRDEPQPETHSQEAGDVRSRPWTPPEDEIIRAGVEKYGKKWVHIASQLENRTADAVRNRFHRLEGSHHALKSRTGEGRSSTYKCKKCGQQKRGHSCPYASGEPVAHGVEFANPAHVLRDLDVGSKTSPDESEEEPEVKPEGDFEGTLETLLRRLNSEGLDLPSPPRARKDKFRGVRISAQDLADEWQPLLMARDADESEMAAAAERSKVDIPVAVEAWEKLLPGVVDDLLMEEGGRDVHDLLREEGEGKAAGARS